MKKILIINLGKEYGGAETLIRNITYHLKQFDISLCVDKDGEFYRKNLILKENILPCSAKKFQYILSIFEIIKYVKKNEIDIIHTHGTPANIIGALCKLIYKCKFIVTIHSDLDYDFSGKKLKIYKKIEKIICYFSDEIVTVSEDLRTKLFLRNIKKKIKVIHNGIDVKISNEEISKDIFTFLFVGRMSKVKNLELLLGGMNHLKNNNYLFKCNIIGEGEEKDKLSKIISNYNLDNYVDFVGFQENVSSYMRNSDLLLITSKMEGIPLVIIEAFANNLPVLASRVGGIPEMIINEKNGFLFDVNNTNEFYQKLIQIIQGNYDLDIIRENAYNDYFEKWNIDHMINQYVLLYNK